jgi:superfamily II helicase
MGFEKLGLTSMIQKVIEELGYQKPTPVQAKVIPAVLEGRDVMATAPGGLEVVKAAIRRNLGTVVKAVEVVVGVSRNVPKTPT